MSTKPKDVKRKLDELYWKTDDIRKELISLHGLLSDLQFFDEPKPQFTNPVPPAKTFVAPPVIPPTPQPQPVEPVIPPKEKIEPRQETQAVPVQPKGSTTVPSPPKKTFSDRYPDLEKFIGERLVTFIGIAVLVTGIAFFVKYAIDKNWIGEEGRTAIGILCGGILLGFAHRLRKTFTTFSSVLAGGGISVLYFTISYAFQVYGLFSQPVAFGLLVVVTGFTVALSVAYDRKELAILALAGGFATPLMVSTGHGNFNVLCTYMLILDLGMLALAWYKKWNLVNYLSYGFTILMFSAALIKEMDAETPLYSSAILFSTFFYLVFFSMNIVNNLKAKMKFEAQEILVLLSNTFLYYICGYFVLHKMGADDYRGLFTLALAAFNFVFAFGLFRRQEVDRLLVYFLIGLVITFVSLAGPVQLSGNHITLFWAAESALLLWLYQRSKLRLIRISSMIVTAAMLISLAVNWTTVYAFSNDALPLFNNKGFITGICAAVSLVISSVLLQKERGTKSAEDWPVEMYHALINIMAWSILYLTGAFELFRQLADSSAEARLVYWNGYTALFMLVSWISLKPLRSEYLRTTVVVFSLIMLVAYAYFPHMQDIELRNNFLVNDSTQRGPFLFHYINLFAIVALAVLVFIKYFGGEKKPARRTAGDAVAGGDNSMREIYLWVMSAAFLFMISAELDHLVVLIRYTPAIMTNTAEKFAVIREIVAQDHKVGYPIAWGICSFIMIFTGIRKKERQLRIIALVLFAITVGKLILLGIYGDSQAGKIVAFILSGIILLLVSFMYQRLKKFLMADEKTEQIEKAGTD